MTKGEREKNEEIHLMFETNRGHRSEFSDAFAFFIIVTILRLLADVIIEIDRISKRRATKGQKNIIPPRTFVR